ncbi:MAG: hypothetical protein IJY87_03005 [Bacilli bacterium]|nr:hypothetical protein [Bacilli bacterium]
MDKKNTMLLTVIAVATLLVAVVGATFAYFTAENTASGSTTATVTTQAVGAVTVAPVDSELHLNLTAAQMAVDAAGTSYYAVTDTEKSFSATQVDATVAQMDATGVAGTVYDCEFTLNIGKDTNIKAGDADLVFTLGSGVTMGNVTSEPIDYASVATSYKVEFEQTGPVNDRDLVKVALHFHNTEDEAGQDHLVGKTLSTTFSYDGMTCVVK